MSVMAASRSRATCTSFRAPGAGDLATVAEEDVVVAGVSVTLDDVEENDAFCSEPLLRTLYRIGVLVRASELQ